MLVPKVARHFSELGSTNSALIEALNGERGLREGDVFLADAQTAGRGQGSNGWHATPNDNLTFSLLLYPDHLSVDTIFTLSRFSALAIAATVRHYLDPVTASTVRIKWPNDIYAGDRKIAGTLIQNGLRGSSVQWSVVGIGLNVNEEAFPPALQHIATSLRRLSGRALPLVSVRDRLFMDLAHFYGRSDSAGRAGLEADYHDQLYRLEQPSTFVRTDRGKRFPAIVKGVDADGRLLLALADGSVEAFELRALRWLTD